MLYAIGLTRESIIDNFYKKDQFNYNKENKMWSTKFIPENYKRPIKLAFNLVDSKTNKKFLDKGSKLKIKFSYCK